MIIASLPILERQNSIWIGDYIDCTQHYQDHCDPSLLDLSWEPLLDYSLGS